MMAVSSKVAMKDLRLSLSFWVQMSLEEKSHKKALQYFLAMKELSWDISF